MKTAWTIAGFSPCGSAGILADIKTFFALKAKCFAITTAVTAQNGLEVLEVKPVEVEMIRAQCRALKKFGWPSVIKVGLLPNLEVLHCVIDCLKAYTGIIIYDPVMKASTGQWLVEEHILEEVINAWLPKVTILTPNVFEAQSLTQSSIHSESDMLAVAKKICQFGVKQVILKGGHFPGQLASDLWTDGRSHQWISLPRLNTFVTHGTGCTFSSALAAFKTLEFETLDALVLAKMAIHKSIQSSFTPTKDLNFIQFNSDSLQDTLPLLSATLENKSAFPKCPEIGFYPVVENLMWVKKLIACGVKCIQLRIKNQTQTTCFQEIREAIKFCETHQVKLFINDEWEFAIKCGAYGVHLGQEDLDKCDLEVLRNSGLRLGISTHSYSELARAVALQPSYIALGPIFHTDSKLMKFAPQGLHLLKRWRELVSCPLVAIGGITLQTVPSILALGVDGISVISAITKAKEPEIACQHFLKMIP